MKGTNQKVKQYTFTRNEKGWKELEHRVIWRKHHGEIEKGMMIHHINGNKKDNRIENLELLTRIQHGKAHRLINRKRIKYPKGIKVLKIDESEELCIPKINP